MDILAHPLSPLPWALANADGSLRKTNKAALARELERNFSAAEDISDRSTCIIDGMSLVQKMNSNNKTFAQLAESVMSLVLHDGSQSHRIEVVFDVYRDTSIKNAERCKRGSSTSIQYRNITEGHNIQQVIEWMRTPPAPDAVLELLSCKCLRSCRLPSCTCLVNGLECTNMCRLQTCSNRKKEEQFPVELVDSDDGDGDDD